LILKLKLKGRRRKVEMFLKTTPFNIAITSRPMLPSSLVNAKYCACRDDSLCLVLLLRDRVQDTCILADRLRPTNLLCETV
jgi:hypothetical protein